MKEVFNKKQLMLKRRQIKLIIINLLFFVKIYLLLIFITVYLIFDDQIINIILSSSENKHNYDQSFIYSFKKARKQV